MKALKQNPYMSFCQGMQNRIKQLKYTGYWPEPFSISSMQYHWVGTLYLKNTRQNSECVVFFDILFSCILFPLMLFHDNLF